MGSKKELNQYIKNKSVIFVGPSPILRGRKLGSWIDSFDIVVRTNGSIFLLDDNEYKKDYGSKCNILSINNQFQREVDYINIKDLKENNKLKFVLAKSLIKNCNINFSSVSTIILGHKIYDSSVSIRNPFMGNIVVSYLLSFGVRTLWVTGIDFYLSKENSDFSKRYIEKYLPQSISSEKAYRRGSKKNISVNNKNQIHDGVGNFMYLYNLISEGKIKINDFILDIMNKKYKEFYND